MEKNLGHATAYGYAKSKGYSGTEEEFAQLMADYASVGQLAAQSAEQAAASATSASGSAATASQAAQTATAKASDAIIAESVATAKAEDAQAYATSANQSAESASTSAQAAITAASTATTKASEAAASEAAALSAKTNAESARDAAAQSASEAAESARTLTIDTTLTQSGQAADAKVVGDAVDELKEDFDLLATITKPEEIDLLSYPYQQGYLAANGAFTPTSGNNAQKTTNAIPLSAGNYKVTFKGQNVNDGAYYDVNYVRAIAVYNSNDECTAYLQTANLENFTVGQNDSYVRINVQYVAVTTYSIHRTDEEVTVSINDNVSIPTDSTLTKISKPANAKAVGDAIKAINIPKDWYMPYRRPLIAFNFDGTYNMNMQFKTLFDRHNVKCGYALPYTTTFPYNVTKEDYRSLQDDGFEILAHSAVAVGTQSSATDEEIRQIVKDAYTTLTGYGFNIHGFVAYQGNAKLVALDEAQRTYDYGATVNNHAGNLAGDLSRANIYFAQDSPYKLWRYSMQSSTLEQMKAAVDECYNTSGFLWLYGHANESQLNNMTLANIDNLLTYIETKRIPILTPYEAIKDFYTVRPQDIVF